MKKNIFVLFALILISMNLVACGSKENKSETVDAENKVANLALT